MWYVYVYVSCVMCMCDVYVLCVMCDVHALCVMCMCTFPREAHVRRRRRGHWEVATCKVYGHWMVIGWSLGMYRPLGSGDL